MRTAMTILILSLTTSRVASAEPADALAIIDKALKAGGGVEKISKFKGLSGKATGKMPVLRDDRKVELNSEMTMEGTFTDAGQVRLSATQNNIHSVFVFSGRHAWTRTEAGETTKVPEADVQKVKDVFHALSLPDRLMALRGKQHKLTIVGDETIDGKTCVSLRIECPGFRDVLLSFDRATGLPIKSAVKMEFDKNPLFSKESWVGFVFADYKEMSGVIHFTRLTMLLDAEEICTLHVKDLKLLTEVDAKEFAKP